MFRDPGGMSFEGLEGGGPRNLRRRKEKPLEPVLWNSEERGGKQIGENQGESRIPLQMKGRGGGGCIGREHL